MKSQTNDQQTVIFGPVNIGSIGGFGLIPQIYLQRRYSPEQEQIIALRQEIERLNAIEQELVRQTQYLEALSEEHLKQGVIKQMTISRQISEIVELCSRTQAQEEQIRKLSAENQELASRTKAQEEQIRKLSAENKRLENEGSMLEKENGKLAELALLPSGLLKDTKNASTQTRVEHKPCPKRLGTEKSQ